MLFSEAIAKYELKFEFELVEFNATTRNGDKPWQHDVWKVRITRGYASLETTYCMGTAHRVKGPSTRGFLANRHDTRVVDGLNPKRYPGGKAFADGDVLWVATEPKAHEVLHCLVIDSDAIDRSFKEWASDLGYDDDSIRALDIYNKCRDIAGQLIALVGLVGLDELRQCEEG